MLAALSQTSLSILYGREKLEDETKGKGAGAAVADRGLYLGRHSYPCHPGTLEGLHERGGQGLDWLGLWNGRLHFWTAVRNSHGSDFLEREEPDAGIDCGVLSFDLSS